MQDGKPEDADADGHVPRRRREVVPTSVAEGRLAEETSGERNAGGDVGSPGTDQHQQAHIQEHEEEGRTTHVAMDRDVPPYSSVENPARAWTRVTATTTVAIA